MGELVQHHVLVELVAHLDERFEGHVPAGVAVEVRAGRLDDVDRRGGRPVQTDQGFEDRDAVGHLGGREVGPLRVVGPSQDLDVLLAHVDDPLDELAVIPSGEEDLPGVGILDGGRREHLLAVTG